MEVVMSEQNPHPPGTMKHVLWNQRRYIERVSMSSAEAMERSRHVAKAGIPARELIARWRRRFP